MAALTAERSHVARRNDVAVKIDAEVARIAKIVASYKDVSLAEYLSEALRTIVEADHRKYAREALEPGPTPKSKPKS